MKLERDLFSKSCRVALLPLLVALQACQSSSPGDVLAIDPSSAPSAAAKGPVNSDEVIGQGQTRLSIVAATSAMGQSEFKDIRNGAALALKDLDDGQLSIEILPVSGGDTAINEKALGAFVKGAAAIAYAGSAPSSGVGNSALQIALLPNGALRPAGSLAFLPSPLDSVEAGIRHHLASGSKGVVVLVPAGQDGASLQTLLLRVKDSGAAQSIEYSPNEPADAIAAKAVGIQGSVFAFTGDDQQIANIASAIRTRLGPQAGIQFVGNGKWLKSAILSAPSLEGALVAMPDFGNEKLISANYRNAYGMLPSAYSLYAYDLVGILAGITRAKGREGLTDGTIRSKAGFRGVTGAFRFRDDGSVERLFEIHQLRGGRLVATAGSSPGF